MSDETTRVDSVPGESQQCQERNDQSNNNRPDPGNEDEFDGEDLLRSGAQQIMNLFLPVSLCMLSTVIVAECLSFYSLNDVFFPYTPFHTPNPSPGTATWESLANVLILMVLIVVVTVILVFLFKYEFYKCINGWIFCTTFMISFMLTSIFIGQIIKELRIFIDYITFAFIVWNVGCMGLIAILWRSPLLLQQGYLIFVSFLLAVFFLKYLPKWTCWVLLGALSIWDLIAVLCPKGPLRMLIELSAEREQPLMPALIYSTTAVFIVNTVDKNNTPEDISRNNNAIQCTSPENNASHASSSNVDANEMTALVGTTNNTNQQVPEVKVVRPGRHVGNRSTSAGLGTNSSDQPMGTNIPSPEITDSREPLDWREIQSEVRRREKSGIMLGLGDFIFYSLLIGRAAVDGDGVTVIACYVAVLVGMCTTIVILGILRKALPALPVSIMCGILFYFVTSVVMSPFVQTLFDHQLMF